MFTMANISTNSDWGTGASAQALNRDGGGNNPGALAISKDRVGVGTTNPSGKFEVFDTAQLLCIKKDTSGSDSATVFQSAGGALYVVPQTLNSAGINAAIEYANAHGSSTHGKPTVYLPEGVYTIDSQIIVHTGMTLMGAGVDVTILEVSVDDDAIVTDAATYGLSGGIPQWLPIVNVVLKGFSVRPASTNSNAAHHKAIYVRGCVYAYLENIAVWGNDTNTRRFKTGIHIKAWEGLLSRCIVKDSYTGFDLSWDDLWDSVNSRYGKIDGTNAVALMGCSYDTFPNNFASPPNSTISTAAFCNGTGSITGISAAFPTVITSAGHGLSNGDQITISGSSTTAVNGTWRITRSNNNTFSIPVSVSVAGNNGSWSQVTCIKFTTSTNHCLQNGTDVNIAGCQNNSYNGDFSNLWVIDGTHFSVDKTANPGAWQAGGSPLATGQVIGCYTNGANNTLVGCTIECDLNSQGSTPLRMLGVYAKGPSHSIISCYFENLRTNFKAVGAPHLNILNPYRTYFADDFESEDFVADIDSSFINIQNGITGYLTWNSGTSKWEGNWSDKSGRVGFGTPTPRGKFDVDGSGDIYLVDDVSAGSSQTLYLPGHIYMAPYGGANVCYLQARRSPDSGNTELQLRTCNAGTITDAVRITGGGNVGVGTTSPGGKLDIETTANGDSRMLCLRVPNATQNNSMLNFAVGAGGNSTDVARIKTEYTAGSNVGLSIHTYSSGLGERVRIDASGKVGVGVTNPADKLSVGNKVLISDSNNSSNPPAGGIVLYVNASGDLMAKNSAGTTRIVADF
jgi:hypothetical protein